MLNLPCHSPTSLTPALFLSLPFPSAQSLLITPSDPQYLIRARALPGSIARCVLSTSATVSRVPTRACGICLRGETGAAVVRIE